MWPPRWSPRATSCCISGAEGGGSVVPVLAWRIGQGREIGERLGLAPMAQRPARGREGRLLPGNLLPPEEAYRRALRARLDLGVEQARAVDQLHLTDSGD